MILILGKESITISEVNEEDWATAWKKYYHPVQISDTIHNCADLGRVYTIHTDEIIIELDPGMAFGTGTHPTTVMCIHALKKQFNQVIHVIDVGTGSGVLKYCSSKIRCRIMFKRYDLDDSCG